MEWKGKTALITGGVSGIGFGIARAFSAAGIDLILTYRNEEYRIEAETWFKRHSRPIPRFVALDVTDRGRWAEIAVEAGSVHILVNNAGVSVFGPTDAASFADYDWIMGVNLGGVVNGLVTFIPRIKAQGQGGHIVNVASMAAYLPGRHDRKPRHHFHPSGIRKGLRGNLPRLRGGTAPRTGARSASAHRASAPRGQSRRGGREGDQLGRSDLSERGSEQAQ